MTRVCTFTLGDRLLGVDAIAVREIVALRELTTVPGGPPHVRGLLNLRGQIVTCLDLGTLIDMAPAVAPQLAVVVDDGAELVSLAIDRVSDVIELDPGDIERVPPTVPRATAAKLAGASPRPGQLLLLLDLPRVLEVATAAEPIR